jgi:hypothetical protein
MFARRTKAVKPATAGDTASNAFVVHVPVAGVTAPIA